MISKQEKSKKEMYLQVLISCVYLGIATSQEQCRTANGDSGHCILLEKCDPLAKINEKEDQTDDDVAFLRKSSCGLHFNTKPKVCCPPEYQWDNYRTTKPFTFPTSGIITTPTPKTTSPLPTPSLNTDRPIVNRPPNYGQVCEPSAKPPHRDSLCCGIEVATSERIVGGSAAGVDQFPWLALLEYEYTGKTHCGGSLISSRYVLTAGHCLGRTANGEPKKVRLSEYNTSSYPIDLVEGNGNGFEKVEVLIINIKNYFIHPKYTKRNGSPHNDIGLVKLETDAPYTEFIRPICLPDRPITQIEDDNIRFVTAGWGSTGIETSEIKLFVVLPYVPLDKCRITYSNTSTRLLDSQICAGGRKGRDSCSGDSGGPLMYSGGDAFELSGIVSFGPTQCGKEGTPAVYTNVHSFIDWIMMKAV